MRGWTRRVVLMVFLLLLCPVRARADLASDFAVEQVQQALPQETRELLGRQLPSADALDGLLEKLWERAAGLFREQLKAVLRPTVGMLALVSLCTAAEGLTESGNGINYVNLCTCLGLALLSMGDMRSLLSLGRETMEILSLFSKALLPTLSAVSAASGALSAAPAKYAASMLFLDLLMNAANALVFPFICAYLAALLADAALPGSKLAAAVKLLKWACGFVMTALVTAFTAYLSLTGLLSASRDALAVKATKTFLSSALPLVGRMVSEASESLVAGAGVLRASLGVFGMLAVLSLCLLPFVSLGLRYLVFKLVAALACVVSGERLSRLIEGVSTACGMLLGLVGTEAAMLYLSIISLIKVVSPS